MNWDEWCKAHPALVVTQEPSHYRYKAETQPEAENAKDKIEEFDEIGGLEVVQFQDYFYVIYRDDLKKLTKAL